MRQRLFVLVDLTQAFPLLPFTSRTPTQAKKHRLEELVAKLEEEDAVLSARIRSAAESQ